MTKWTDELQIAYQEGANSVKVATGKYGEGGANTPVNKDTMPWLYGDDDDEPGTDPAEIFEQLELFPEAMRNQIKDLMIAGGGVLLPGESPAGGKGGLGSMNKDQLERWIKENGITGPGADKIRQKHKGLQGGTDLFPLAQVTPGPAPTWPMHKWPHPTPGQGPLPNPNIPDNSGLQISNLPPGALEALKAGTKKGLSSRQIRDLLKPYTQQDQFGHPSGRMKV